MNHDDTSGTVDLFSKTTLTSSTIPFHNTAGYLYAHYYNGSNLDTYLESTVYGGFADNVKNNLVNMHIQSNNTIIQRHVVAPSPTELGFTPLIVWDDSIGSAVDGNLIEGQIYPIFAPMCSGTNPKAGIGKLNGNGSEYICGYWTRSRTIPTDNMNDHQVIIVYVDTGMLHTSRTYEIYAATVARIRFAKA